MSAKLDNCSNTVPNLGWWVSGHILKTKVLTTADKNLLGTFMTNGKKAIVETSQDNGYEPMTLDQIALIESVSHQRVAQILNSALRKFHKAMDDKGIKKEDLL